MPSGSSKWASGKRSLTLRPPAALRTEEGSHGPQGPASMRDAWRGSRGKSRECRGHSDHARRREGDQMGRFNKLMLAVLVPGLITLCACQDLVPRDTRSLLIPSLRRSEIFGFLAGFGTDLCRRAGLARDAQTSIKRRHEPKDGDNHGRLSDPVVYYGLLIALRLVILWNVVAVLVNFLSVGAYLHFVRK